MSARIVLDSAGVDASDHVVVGFTLQKDGKGADAATAAALMPWFTLAALGTDPVSGIGAWRSLLLTGGQTLAQHPIEGPGTPPANVLVDVKQPGFEASGTLAALGAGTFRYTFANPLPAGHDPGETLRVGVFLYGAPGSPDTTDTIDFVPSGATPAPRETVLDLRCNACHGSVTAHGGHFHGVRLCLTCHTYQNADPDTVDPAALDGATGATNPNPLDFGRLVHRIHRGKNLPTLYQSSSTAPAPALPSPSALPLPFFPGRNAPVLGRKYSVVGYQGREFVFGRVENRFDNGQPALTVAAGVVFPRDLRDCAACHQGAAHETEAVNAISRRTCAGCHPEVWFGTDPITDAVHFAHPGGPQADDTQCAGCHVAATPLQPKVYAPIAEMHVVPRLSPRFNGLTAEIVSVTNMRPGQNPTVVFTLADRDGAPSPLNAPTPAFDAQSPVRRALEYVDLTFSGPAERDFATSNTVIPGPWGTPVLNSPYWDLVPLTTAADASGRFTRTIPAPIPADATGTWAVGLEARRRNYPPNPCQTPHYDVATDNFPWPGTGECLIETAVNPVVYVDVAVGTWTAGTASPRRTVVSNDRCNACHGLLEFHGRLRNRVEYCLLCHVPDRTDWERRPKVNGNTNLSGTFDGIEERSIHFKTMIHRIHTGGRVGAAALDVIQPFLVYGYGGAPFFFDEGIFPNDLRNCNLCHEPGTYLIASVPAGAPATVANENAWILHDGTVAHAAYEPATPPIQAACMGCHATGSTLLHAQRNTVNGVERCASCHTRGSTGVESAHGLSP
ncbi:MAG TPA: OmcA/MtrC family decaheme c-type cytochrome [Anaeromyxobacteraceae bacterium]|nr:OmcA/MtrC family decaheme c-type cytochrome [Anaeromyxobacteraceae bacterium]